MLPILHALQEEYGFISSDAIPVIADALNLTRAEVHGVVTFYMISATNPVGIIFYSFAVARLARALEVRAWRQPYSAAWRWLAWHHS